MHGGVAHGAVILKPRPSAGCSNYTNKSKIEFTKRCALIRSIHSAMKRRIVVAVFSLPVLVCVLLLCSALHVMPGLLHSECEMTYMYTWPQYQRLNLSLELERAYPQYSLHLYRETRNKVEPTLDWAPLRLSGVPALFIPGNAGSHKQGGCAANIFQNLLPTSSSLSLLQFAPQPQ